MVPPPPPVTRGTHGESFPGQAALDNKRPKETTHPTAGPNGWDADPHTTSLPGPPPPPPKALCQPPPPQDQSDHCGEKRNLRLGKSDQAIFGSQNFRSQIPPPPSPSSHTSVPKPAPPLAPPPTPLAKAEPAPNPSQPPGPDPCPSLSPSRPPHQWCLLSQACCSIGASSAKHPPLLVSRWLPSADGSPAAAPYTARKVWFVPAGPSPSLISKPKQVASFGEEVEVLRARLRLWAINGLYVLHSLPQGVHGPPHRPPTHSTALIPA